jgi:uncharacterized membrane protein YbhN (UPF0104 family)
MSGPQSTNRQMQPLSRYLLPVLLAGLALACLSGLRSDLALISFAPLVRSWDLVALAAFCSLLNYMVRIVRWQLYLARLGHSMPVAFVSLTYLAGFAFTVSPGKVGEMARARYYSRVAVELPDVAGAFFVERLMDVIAMMGLAVLIVAAISRYQLAIWATGLLSVLVLTMLATLPWYRIARWVETCTSLPAPVLRLTLGATEALEAARALLSPAPLLWGFALGLLAWGLEGVGLSVLASIFPTSHLGAATGIGIYAVAVLVGAISFMPGGLGSTEAVMTALLSSHGYSVAEGLSITIACRVVTLWLAVAIGWGAVFILRNRMVPAVS